MTCTQYYLGIHYEIYEHFLPFQAELKVDAEQFAADLKQAIEEDEKRWAEEKRNSDTGLEELRETRNTVTAKLCGKAYEISDYLHRNLYNILDVTIYPFLHL